MAKGTLAQSIPRPLIAMEQSTTHCFLCVYDSVSPVLAMWLSPAMWKIGLNAQWFIVRSMETLLSSCDWLTLAMVFDSRWVVLSEFYSETFFVVTCWWFSFQFVVNGVWQTSPDYPEVAEGCYRNNFFEQAAVTAAQKVKTEGRKSFWDMQSGERQWFKLLK